MRSDDIFCILARKVSLQLGAESPYYTNPDLLKKRVTNEGDEWFADPNEPTNDEIVKYATMVENHKRTRCEECGKVLPITTKRVVKRNPESPEWLCRKCKIALERVTVKDSLGGTGKTTEGNKNKSCQHCNATFTDLPSGNRVRQHTKDCKGAVT